MLKVRLGVVTTTELDLHVLSFDADRNSTKPPVLRRVWAGITQHVVHRGIFLHFGECGTEVIAIEKCLSSCVSGERHQGFLRGNVGIERCLHGPSGEHCGAAATATTASTAPSDTAG